MSCNRQKTTLTSPTRSCGDNKSQDLYEHVNSYVDFSQHNSQCNYGDNGNSQYRKVATPKEPYGIGMSSRDLAFPSCNNNNSVSRFGIYNPCGDKKNSTSSVSECDAWDDVIISEPRDLPYIDNFLAPTSYMSNNFNQNYDLRGDLPPSTTASIPVGARFPPRGQHEVAKKYRGYVY